MRDLAARLRDIVRKDHGGGALAPSRELTYVPETDGMAADPSRAARALGGTLLEADQGVCVVIDRVWEESHGHGRDSVGSCAPSADGPLGLFDARAAAAPAWFERVVFFDLETTGLSGGAGTLPFLAGCGWFEGGAFRVRQFFLASPAGERAMLHALARIFDDATLLVTFNGRTFDVPLMETRWAFHRAAAPTGDLPHFDMLPPARRLWGARGLDDAMQPSSCALSSLERSVLGFHRVGDVPGFEIPLRYFQFLRSGHAETMEGVLEHNRHDLLSLAAVMSHALWLAREGPDACREPSEQMGLGRLYERAGDHDRALVAFERASSATSEIREHALARLATLLGRVRRHDEAAAAWQALLDETRRRRGPASALARRAVEALAIHHEHRARDLSTARTFAIELRTHADERAQRAAAHRLGRIDRKLDAKSGGRLL
jgi:uncharacterized protein YprB with RNaseH-like and TPR domain